MQEKTESVFKKNYNSLKFTTKLFEGLITENFPKDAALLILYPYSEELKIIFSLYK